MVEVSSTIGLIAFPNDNVISCVIDGDIFLCLIGLGVKRFADPSKRELCLEHCEGTLTKLQKLRRKILLNQELLKKYQIEDERLYLNPHSLPVKNEADHMYYETRIESLTNELCDQMTLEKILNSESVQEYAALKEQREKGFYSKYVIKGYNILSGESSILEEGNNLSLPEVEFMDVTWVGLLETLINNQSDAHEVVKQILSNDVGKVFRETPPFAIHREYGRNRRWIIESKESWIVDIHTVEDILIWLESLGVN